MIKSAKDTLNKKINGVKDNNAEKQSVSKTTSAQSTKGVKSAVEALNSVINAPVQQTQRTVNTNDVLSAVDKAKGNLQNALGSIKTNLLISSADTNKDAAVDVRDLIRAKKEKTDTASIRRAILTPDKYLGKENGQKLIDNYTLTNTLKNIDSKKFADPYTLKKYKNEALKNGDEKTAKYFESAETYYGMFKDKKDFDNNHAYVDYMIQYSNMSDAELEAELKKYDPTTAKGTKDKSKRLAEYAKLSDKEKKDVNARIKALKALRESIKNEDIASEVAKEIPLSSDAFVEKKIKDKDEMYVDYLVSLGINKATAQSYVNSKGDKNVGMKYGSVITAINNASKSGNTFENFSKSAPAETFIGKGTEREYNENEKQRALNASRGYVLDDANFYKLTGHGKDDYMNKTLRDPSGETGKIRLDKMTNEEASMVIYLSRTKGQKSAWEYLTSKETRDKFGKRIQQETVDAFNYIWEESNTLGKICLNVYSVAHNAVVKPIAFADATIGLVTNTYDPYSGLQTFSQTGDLIRESTKSDITKGIDNKVLKYVVTKAYEVPMGAADMYFGNSFYGSGTSVKGLNFGGYTVAMGLGAGADDARKTYENGGNRLQVFSSMMASFLGETLTEAFGMEWMLKGISSGAVKDVLKGMAAEGLEEVVGNFASRVSDSLIMQDKSELSRTIDYLRQQGYSDGEITQKILLDYAKEDADAFVTSALSAGFFEIGGAAANNAHNNAIKNSYGSNILDNDNENQLADFARLINDEQVQTALEKMAEEPTKKQLGNLYVAVRDYLSNQERSIVQQSVEQRLSQLGYADSVNAAADIVAMANLEDIDESRKQNVLNNTTLANVYQELVRPNLTQYINIPEIARQANPSWISSMMFDLNGIICAKNVLSTMAVENVDKDSAIAMAEYLSPEYNSQFKQSVESENAIRLPDNMSRRAQMQNVEQETVPEATADAETNAEAESKNEALPFVQEPVKENNKFTDKQKNDIVKLGKKLNRKVSFADINVYDENGNVVLSPDGQVNEDGSITLNESAKNPYSFIVKHELTHLIENDKKAWDKFYNALKTSKVFNRWLVQKDAEFRKIADGQTEEWRQEHGSTLKENYMKRYEKAYGSENLSAKIDVEIACDFVGEQLFGAKDVLDAKKILNSIKNENERKTFADYVRKLIDWLKSKFATDFDTVERLEKLWGEAFRQSNLVDDNKDELNNGIKYLLVGVNEKGIEVYETSKETMSLTWDERIKKYEDIMKNEFHGRTARFVRNGHTYYAEFDEKSTPKIIFGEKGMSRGGKKAIIKAGADGDIFDIVENSVYAHSSVDKKNHKRKDGFTDYFDYFYKTVQIDGNVFDIIVNVKKSFDSQYGYTYTIKIADNKKIKASPAEADIQPSKGQEMPSANSILQSDAKSQQKLSNGTKNVDDTENDSKSYSIPQDFDSLLEDYENGKISRQEFREKANEEYGKKLEQYGAIEPGENATEDSVRVPKSVDGKTKVRRHIRTIIESGVLTDDMIEDLGTSILKGDTSYEVISNKDVIESAESKLESGVLEKEWDKATAKETFSADAVAAGDVLLREAVENGDRKRAVEITCELSDMLTRAGQTIQAARIIGQLGGVGRLYHVTMELKKLQREIDKRPSSEKKNVKLEVNKLLAEQLAEAETEYEAEAIEDLIKQDLADQIPATLYEKLNAFRYLSMLGNPRTHIRNVVGNAIFTPAVQTKDIVAASLESVFVKPENRTKSVVIKKEYRDFAQKMIEEDKGITNALKGGKYNERNMLSDERRIFNNALLNFLSETNSKALEYEDIVFKNLHFKRAFAGFLQARKVDITKPIDKATKTAAIEYAVSEAQKATFNDYSALANALSNLGKKNKLLGFFVESLVPFKRTPVNIVKRGIEYSPIGLLKELSYGTKMLTLGKKTTVDGKTTRVKITASEYIDGIARGLTGSAVALIGYVLTSSGILRGPDKDDKDKYERDAVGKQQYSITIAGHTYTIDWAAPSSIPLLLGSKICELFHGEKPEWTEIPEVLFSALDPIIELTMLDGIQNALKSVATSLNDPKKAAGAFGNLLETVGVSYLSQYIPTLLGQVARTVDPYRRDSSKKYGNLVDKLSYAAQSKIPGLTKTLPAYIDPWGRQRKNSGWFENFFSPGYYSKPEYNKVDKELLRLNEATGEDNVFPSKPSKSFEVDGEKISLKPKEYEKFAKSAGQLSLQYINELIKNDRYNELDDDQKAEVISKLYGLSKAKAKGSVSDYDYTQISTFKGVYYYEDEGGSAVDYYIDNVKNKSEGGSTVVSPKAKKEVDSLGSNLSAKEKDSITKSVSKYYAIEDSDDRSDYEEAEYNRVKKATAQGISVVEYYTAKNAIKKVNADSNGDGKVTKLEKRKAIENLDFSRDKKTKLKNILNLW